MHHLQTILATLACILIIISPTSHRTTGLTFVGANSLDYFLELWGTTRYANYAMKFSKAQRTELSKTSKPSLLGRGPSSLTAWLPSLFGE